MDLLIETERLILRKFVEDDDQRLFLLDSNPEVMKYIGIPPVTDRADSKALINHILHQYKTLGIGRLAVIEKESGLLIGWSGLKMHTEKLNGHQNFYDLGYRFLPETWGKGYATEAAKASLALGFNDLKAETIYAYAHSENKASHKILRSLGFEHTGDFTEPDGICFWYEIRRKNYQS